MMLLPRSRLINPHLGIYYGIYASLLAALVLMVAMFEQLGWSDGLLRGLMFAIPVILYAGFGIAATTRDPYDYFAAGRRIPPFFAGLVLSMAALGGVGFISITGTFALIGTDAFVLVLGWIGGLVVMAVLVVPFLRKVGAHSVASYLGLRFESRLVRVVAAAIFSVPVLLVLVAEIRLAANVASTLVGQPESVMILTTTAFAAIIVAGGGMRSLTWSSAAQAILAMLALATIVTIVSLLVSSLPIPQMTQGNMLRNVARIEAANGTPILIASPFLFELPGRGLEFISKQYVQMFGSVGSWAFTATELAIVAGIASMPTLLSRAGTASGVYDARKSMGWAVLITAFCFLTLTAAAAFYRGYLVDQVAGQTGGRLPLWFQDLQQRGWASVQTKTGPLQVTSIGIKRDTVIYALAVAAGMPVVLLYLAMAGAMAAAMAAAAAGVNTLATMIAEDVVGLPSELDPKGVRVTTAQIASAAAGILAAAIALVASDPLQMALWGITVSAAACFPVLLLSVFWKRLNAWGAIAAMVTGLAVSLFLILAGQASMIGMAGPQVALFAIPLAVIAAVIVTQITPPVGRSSVEFIRDMRVPGGETMVDRRLRLERIKRIGR